MAYIVVVYTVMAYVVMAYKVMADAGCNLAREVEVRAGERGELLLDEPPALGRERELVPHVRADEVLHVEKGLAITGRYVVMAISNYGRSSYGISSYGISRRALRSLDGI